MQAINYLREEYMLKKRIAAIGIVFGAALSAGVVGTPAYALSPQESGDPQLLNTLRPHLAPDKYDNVSIGYVDGNTNTVRTAHFGSNDATEYEIGSISKTFLGNLYGVALANGEVTNNQRIGTLLPIGTGPVWPTGSRSLDELTSHRAGLPNWSATPGSQAQLLLFTMNDTPIYFTNADLNAHARATLFLPNVGSYQYSNMGASLLGQGLASAANTNYKSLITNRQFTPLGLSNTYIATEPADVAGKSRGKLDNGNTASATATGSYAPSGDVRSNTTDMTKYISKLLKNEVPGQTSTTPRWNVGEGRRIGYNWFTDANNRTWHNGQTGGYGAMLKYDKAAKKGVIIMADRSRGADITNNQLAEKILDANL